jgi:DNA-binding HxlR family transcriptional regulator
MFNGKPPTQEQCTVRINAVGDALYAIGGKWKLRIIIALSDGAKRFNDLQRAVTGISARVLSNELKELEMNGFVQRNIQIESSVIIDYELTAYSQTLEQVLQSLSDWGLMHRNKIKQDMADKTNSTPGDRAQHDATLTL